MDNNIYFDNNATTQIHPEVFEAMLPYINGKFFGNSSSLHSYGRKAKEAIELARFQIATAINCQPNDIIFTSGGSEANNLIIKSGIVDKNKIIAISNIEHPCVSQPAWQLTQWQSKVKLILSNDNGEIDKQGITNLFANNKNNVDDFALISVMYANNESGVINNIAEIAKEIKQQNNNIVFHSDAVQAFGKVAINFTDLHNNFGVDAMSISSHKIYGPQGIGALVVSQDIDILPLISGGGQERGLRSGTENVAAIVGFGAAAKLLNENLQQNLQHYKALQQCLENGLKELGAIIFGDEATNKLANTTYFSLAENLDGATLVSLLDANGFSVATGSACSSGRARISHVLQAMNIAPEWSSAAVRISFGINNTIEEVKQFLYVLQKVKNKLLNLKSI